MAKIKRQQIPTVDDGTDAALEYANRFFGGKIGEAPKNRYRQYKMTQLTRNLLMRQGQHWKRVDMNSRPTATGMRYVDVRTYTDGRQPPVDNMVGAGIRNIVGRLVKREYEPEPQPAERKPDLIAAASMNRDILLYDLEQAQYQERIDKPITEDVVTFGTCWGVSRLDETLVNAMPIASTSAAKCVGCGAIFADKEFDPVDAGITGAASSFMFDDKTQRIMDRSQPGEGGRRKMGVCPMCDEGANLGDYDPNEEEAEGGVDVFGRRLGQDAPKFAAIWEARPLHELYPEDGGIIDTHECRVWGIETVRSMQWLEARLGPKAVADIEPMSVPELMASDPMLSDPWFSEKIDENVFGDHVLTRELIVESLPHGGDGPTDGLRWGRRLLIAGEDHLVVNSELEREVEGTEERIPTVAVAAAVCDGVRRRFYGRTPVDDAIPLNIAVNRNDYIEEQRSERMVPLLALPDGVDFYARKPAKGGLMNTYNYANNSDMKDWNPKDAVMFGGPHVTGNVNRRETLVQAIREILGPGPTDSGGAGGANSARQLIVQAEQSAQKLNPFDAARVTVHTKLWKHHQDLVWAFRRGEKGTYEKKTAAGTYEVKSYEGTEILKQTKIRLQLKGTTDKSLLQAEQAEKGAGLGLYGGQGPLSTLDQESRDQLLELMNLPKLNSQTSIQVKLAEQLWSAFVSDRKVPYLDLTISDSWINYQVLGKRWLGDEAQQIQAACGWENAVRALAGWEPELAKAIAKDDQQRAIYEGYPPEQWPGIQAQLTASIAQVNQAALPVAGMPPSPQPPAQQMPPPVAPPQNGQFLPKAPCDRMLQLWRGMLTQAGVLAPPADTRRLGLLDPGHPEVQAAQGQADLDLCLRFYAVIQDCRIDARAKGQGAPQPAAPGGSRTPDGSVPQGGQGVIPAPGVGPGEAAA